MTSGVSSRIAAAILGARAVQSRVAWRGAVAAAVLAISACSTNNVLSLRPDVDVGTTAGLPRGGGMQELVPDDPYLQQAEAAQQPEEAPEAAQDVAMMRPDMSEPDISEPAMSEPDMGEPGLGGQAAAAPNLAPRSLDEQAAAIEPGYPADVAMSQPSDVGGPNIGAAADGDTDFDEPAGAGARLAMAAPPRVREPFKASPPPPEPANGRAVMLAAYPRVNRPALSGPAPMPADEIACRRELKKLGVSFRELNPIRDSASCRIDHPIKVSVLPGNVALKPAATLNCEMALTFAKWTKNELNPAARRRYWSRVKTIHQMSSYSCRRINRSHSMSEHSKGNALDVGRIELSNGKDIDVEKPGLFAFRTRGFLDTVRSDGCDYFSTVLGPGYNWDHRNHFHFDIKPRRNGRVACH